MTKLTELTIAQAREALKKKEFSAVELTKAYIDEMNDKRKYNAYVLETPDVALAQAQKSDENMLTVQMVLWKVFLWESKIYTALKIFVLLLVLICWMALSRNMNLP